MTKKDTRWKKTHYDIHIQHRKGEANETYMEEKRKHRLTGYNIAFPSIRRHPFFSSFFFIPDPTLFPRPLFYPILVTVTYYILITLFSLSFLVLAFALHPLFD